MLQYKVVYGRNYLLLSTYQTVATSVPAADDYYNRHNELRNSAYQALKLARIRSTRTTTKRRTPRPPVPVGGQVLVFGDMFSTESGQSKKLEPPWREPFTVLSYDDITQNYTVKMDARMYHRREAVFYCSVVNSYRENDNERFPGRAYIKPVPLLINEEPEWEVEAILNYRENY